MTDQPAQQPNRPPLWDDPAIEEVRAIRRKLWDDSGRNIRNFIEQTRQAAQRRQSTKPPQRDAS